MVEVGDIIMYCVDKDSFAAKEDDTLKDDVGIITKITPSGTKAAVLWASETVPLYFSLSYMRTHPVVFKLVKKQG